MCHCHFPWSQGKEAWWQSLVFHATCLRLVWTCLKLQLRLKGWLWWALLPWADQGRLVSYTAQSWWLGTVLNISVLSCISTKRHKSLSLQALFVGLIAWVWENSSLITCQDGISISEYCTWAWTDMRVFYSREHWMRACQPSVKGSNRWVGFHVINTQYCKVTRQDQYDLDQVSPHCCFVLNWLEHAI